MTAPLTRTPDDDPTGITFDRADIEETTTAKAGDGWAPTGRTGAAVDEPAGQCAERGELGRLSKPPFNLRELAQRHMTAAQQDLIERGAA